MTAIRFSDVTKSFGANRVVERVNLSIHSGELFFLLGPSGCGKTTLLRMLAGFVEPDEGDIFLGERSLRGVPPRLRDTALVFQNYALWPHRTVAGNVAYGLEVRGLSRREIGQRVEQALKLVRLEGLSERRPAQLSGGQQQRVALARALVIQPRVLLLDEPLSNLDARLRLEMREEIRRLHQATKLTMIYVTHDQKEALSLADRLAVMHRGQVAQVGTPVEVYSTPCSRFVADFMGDSNFIPGTVREMREQGRCLVETPLGMLNGVAPDHDIDPGRAVTCSIRPEALSPAGSFVGNVFHAVVERTAFLGEVLHVELKAGALALQAVSLHNGLFDWKPGAQVRLAVPAEQVVVLSE
jgi:iron(III) transport system ATP-binding protein